MRNLSLSVHILQLNSGRYHSPYTIFQVDWLSIWDNLFWCICYKISSFSTKHIRYLHWQSNYGLQISMYIQYSRIPHALNSQIQWIPRYSHFQCPETVDTLVFLISMPRNSGYPGIPHFNAQKQWIPWYSSFQYPDTVDTLVFPISIPRYSGYPGIPHFNTQIQWIPWYSPFQYPDTVDTLVFPCSIPRYSGYHGIPHFSTQKQ